MSHEIRTPLNAIVGYISILKRSENDATKRAHLDIIDRSSDLLLGIINDVLDYSKLTNNKLSLDLVECPIVDEIHQQLSLFTPLCQNKHINLKSTIDPHIPALIEADTLRINQVLANLLSNAVKFTPENSQITLEALFKNNRIYFNVIDQGIGIAPQAQSKIFDSFQQADESTTRQYGGSGLGLAIAYKIVEMFGSKLTVKSRLNEGSTFSFDIQAKAIEKETSSAKDKQTTFNQEKILVAEDIKTNQMLINLLLDELNLKATLVNDGQEAVKAYNSDFSLVLMDINMPNMDGLDAMKIIKKQYPQALIIALTANAMIEDKKHYLESGFDDYISKPIDFDKLQTLLAQDL